MFDSGGDVGGSPADTTLAAAADGLRSAVDDGFAVAFASCSGVALTEYAVALEVQRRRLAALENAVVATIDASGVAGELGCARTSELLSRLLRIDPREAARRVRTAGELGPRRELNGTPLPPLFARVAAAGRDGAISPMQAQIITRTIDRLPLAIQADQDTHVEATLVACARELDAQQLRVAAVRLTDLINPDGILDTERDVQRQRHFSLRTYADGSCEGTFRGDAILTEGLRSVFDTLARPMAQVDGQRDPRTTGQRQHDALKDLVLMQLRSGDLPDCGGIATTILLTTTEDDFVGGEGLVRTGHGGLISAATAQSLVGDAQVQVIRLTPTRGIEAYSDTHRIFTAGQRRAMAARDHGCSHPGCTRPPAWCEAHHVIEFTRGGPTSVANGTLLCGEHHREHERLGWRGEMIAGYPHWIPPTWIDPEQRPLRNHAHEPVAVLDHALRLPAPSQAPSSESASSEPTRSEPTRSEPTRSEPTRSEPTRSEPTRSVAEGGNLMIADPFPHLDRAAEFSVGGEAGRV